MFLGFFRRKGLLIRVIVGIWGWRVIFGVRIFEVDVRKREFEGYMGF